MTLSPTLRVKVVRVELLDEARRRGKWRWDVPGTRVGGVSREPLLSACRELRRMGVPPSVNVGLFRKGRSKPDLPCSVGVGAALTVDEDGPRFRKWKPRPIGAGLGWPGKSAN